MQKLINVQAALKAPKSQRNDFGKYNYRSCEDILEAVKPLLVKDGLLLTVSDEIVLIGERYYVKATATVYDGDKQFSTSAFAREPEDKKGADASQITGAASSYARKYALNGLFAIDDTKDSDATNDHGKGDIKHDNSTQPAKPAHGESGDLASEAQLKAIYAISKSKGRDVPANVKAMTKQAASNLIKELQSA